VTVVWLEEPCTSSDWPVMEATVPVAPGMVLGVVEGMVLGVVEGVVLAEEVEPPHAARASTHPPSRATAGRARLVDAQSARGRTSSFWWRLRR
jgi:hypothetical protein